MTDEKRDHGLSLDELLESLRNRGFNEFQEEQHTIDLLTEVDDIEDDAGYDLGDFYDQY